MQQFTVPQFIDVEDKIFGPITTRQFLIILFCFMVVAILYKLLIFSWFVVSAFIILSLGAIISFAKVNGRPFHHFILNVAQTFGRPNIRVWYKDLYDKTEKDEVEKDEDVSFLVNRKPKQGLSRLTELSLIVDTMGSYQGETRFKRAKIKTIKKTIL